VGVKLQNYGLSFQNWVTIGPHKSEMGRGLDLAVRNLKVMTVPTISSTVPQSAFVFNQVDSESCCNTATKRPKAYDSRRTALTILLVLYAKFHIKPYSGRKHERGAQTNLQISAKGTRGWIRNIPYPEARARKYESYSTVYPHTSTPNLTPVRVKWVEGFGPTDKPIEFALNYFTQM
jgi:hypothetical protein